MNIKRSGGMRPPDRGPIRVSRRTALRLAAASALGVWTGQVRQAAAGADPRRLSVLVLGAGLAGLTAALELARRGHHVRVLEWQDRVGGRVYSTGRGLAESQVAELGAARIPDIHDFTWHYVREFRLPTATFPRTRSRFQVGGEAFLQPAPGQPWPLKLRDAEKADPLHYPAATLAGTTPGWGAADVPGADLLGKFDALTMVDWLRTTDASPAVIGLFLAANGGRSRENGAVLEGIQEILEEEIRSFSAIRGGNDRLPRAMAEELGVRVLTGVRVERIARYDDRVEVVARHAGEEDRPYTYTADRLVCALPAPILRGIAIEPRLPEPHRAALAAVAYSRASKTVIQTRTRFWKELGVEGLMIVGTDTPAERVWDVGIVQPGTMGLLHQYNMAAQPALDGLPADARWRRTVELLAPSLPGLAEQAVYHSFWDWARQPWVGGGIPNIPPGGGAALKVLPRPVGRVHFAGDYTTIWAGWMQGAIQSGLRAAQEIDPTVRWAPETWRG